MMKAVLADGTALDGTPQEIAEVLRAIHALSTNGSSKSSSMDSISKAVRSAGVLWTRAMAEAFVNSLEGRQKLLVEFLASQADGRAPRERVKNHLSAKSQEVAGLRANITRNARRETNDRNAKPIVGETGEDGTKYYKLIPEVLEVLSAQQ